MEKAERAGSLPQGVVQPETPGDRRERASLEEDLGSIPLRGQRIALRLRNFLLLADAYLAATRGPMAYMQRLREIELETADHEQHLSVDWRALAEDSGGNGVAFTRAWEAVAAGWSFRRVDDLIERHNRWYPIEARLAVDPKTGDYALVNGRDYRLDTTRRRVGARALPVGSPLVLETDEWRAVSGSLRYRRTCSPALLGPNEPEQLALIQPFDRPRSDRRRRLDRHARTSRPRRSISTRTRHASWA